MMSASRARRGRADAAQELGEPVLAGGDRLVARRVGGPAAARQALDQSVVVRLVEEGDREPAVPDRGFARRFHHAVHGRDPAVIGPVLHEIADIADEGAGRWADRYPLGPAV